RAEAKAKAADLARRVVADPAALGPLAREHSDCPSKANDGHLGQIGRGSLVPELESYIFAMKAGETCPVPVPSRYGWHVVRVLERADGRELPYESVRAKIADYLAEASWRRAVSQYISLLAGRAAIEGVVLRAAASPLVQRGRRSAGGLLRKARTAPAAGGVRAARPAPPRAPARLHPRRALSPARGAGAARLAGPRHRR